MVSGSFFSLGIGSVVGAGLFGACSFIQRYKNAF